MKRLISRWLGVVPILLLILFSCQKDYSSRISMPETNKPPIANAGGDQVIILPRDYTVLDGSSSNDPDGTIAKFKWTKIAGPESGYIVDADSAKTAVHSLTAGIYHFELMVTDNKGESNRDTVLVTVTDGSNKNISPVANAGEDKGVVLPTYTCLLDGSASYDPDGTISAYQWKNLTTSLPCVIANPTTVRTLVTGLVKGVYQFELTVTDNMGATAKDTVDVSVYLQNPNACPTSNRTKVNATLTEIGTLSLPRIPYVGTVGSKIVFAGGFHYVGQNTYVVSSVVDIYDMNTGQWDVPANLSSGREGIAVATCGNKIFFAGGGYFFTPSDIVDIYEVNKGWKSVRLSEPRMFMAAAVVGNKVYFAGGYTEMGVSNKVDVYDLLTDSWAAPITMPVPRAEFSAVAVGDKIYFAGGDVYNTSTKMWSTFQWMLASEHASGVALGDQIYWSGMALGYDGNVCLTQILNFKNGAILTGCLSYQRDAPAAIVRNNQVALFSNPVGYMGNDLSLLVNDFDIYNGATEEWLIGVLPISIGLQSVISVNNTVYLAGGKLGPGVCSNKVYKVSW